MDFLIIPVAAIFNRMRGDDTWLRWLKLPGRALWYMAPMIGLLAWVVHPWPVAAAWALAFLGWAVFGWGHLYGLGRYQPERDIDRLSATLLEIAGGNVHAAFFLRQLAILPGLALVSLVAGDIWPAGAAIPAAALFVAAYEAGWRWMPPQPILTAELIVGALWGAMIISF